MSSAPIFLSPPLSNAIPLLPHQMFNAVHLLPTQALMLVPHETTRRRVQQAGDAETVGPAPLPSPNGGDDEDDYFDEFQALMPPPEIENGLPEELIAIFLKTATCEKKSAAADGGNPELCAVCLDDLHQEDRTVGVLGCRHSFHGVCIGKWLQEKNVCPLCRAIALEIS